MRCVPALLCITMAAALPETPNGMMGFGCAGIVTTQLLHIYLLACKRFAVCSSSQCLYRFAS